MLLARLSASVRRYSSSASPSSEVKGRAIRSSFNALGRLQSRLKWFYLFPFGALGLAFVTWQRAEDMEVVVQKRKQNLTLAPVPLPLDPTPEQLDSLDHRLVYVSGELLHERELRVIPRYFETQMGLQIITPLRRKDGSIVLINRGWVPAIMKEPETRKEAQLTEKVTILGHLMPSEEQQGFTLGTGKALFKSLNVPERNFWSRIDLEEMADWVNASPIMVSALVDPPNPGGYPIGGQTDFQIDNWLRTEAYQLGGTALFMFAALVGSRYVARLGRMPWQKAPPKGTPFSD